jgi:hypothetical protein
MSDGELDVAAWARQAFAKGFQLDGAPLSDHRDLTPNDLAGTLARMGVGRAEVEATGKILRDVAILEEPEDTAPLSAAQRESIASLLAHEGLPRAIRDVLGAASDKLDTQRDLHILTYVFVSASERM